MKYYKMMFIMMIFISSMVSISSNSWLMMWIGLEINLLSIMPIMKMDNNIMSSESSIKYFITQSMASTVILASVVVMMWKFNHMSSMFNKQNLNMMMNSSFLMKMGMSPFHFWFPEVMEGQSWINCLMLLTWQKLTPMILFMINNSKMIFISMVIASSMIVSGIMAMNQTSLRKIMTYSSINHMGWIMSTMILSKTTWMVYFTLYSMISMSLIVIFMKNKLNLMKQMFNKMNNSQMIKILFSMNFMSLMGLPPFLGFMPKWISVQVMITNNMLMMAMFMLILTMLMMFTYLRMTVQFMMIKWNTKNWKHNTNKNSMMNMMMMVTSLFSLPMTTMMFNMF
nr:NADH dehydrogenase subunit 2 [Stenocladius bicoloripes]